MEHKYEYELLTLRGVVVDDEEQMERGKIPVGTGDGFQPRENAAVHTASVGLFYGRSK